MSVRLVRIALLLLIISCAGCGEGKAPPSAVDMALARFHSFRFNLELPSVDGEKVSLADYRGKVVIVDFWGTWCPPCRDEIPHFVSLYHTYHAEGLDIIGVNYEQVPGERAIALVRRFIAELHIPYVCVMGDDRTKRQVPGLSSFPTTLFIDRSGKVRFMLTGNMPQDALEAVVIALLAEPAPAIN